MIAIDLSEKQEPDADLKAVQQINFTGNLQRAENISMFFIIEKAKETIYIFTRNYESVANVLVRISLRN